MPSRRLPDFQSGALTSPSLATAVSLRPSLRDDTIPDRRLEFAKEFSGSSTFVGDDGEASGAGREPQIAVNWEEETMPTTAQRSLQARIDQRENVLLRQLTESQKAVRHKCFTSFHQADEGEVEGFIDTFQDAFLPRVLGVSDEDDFIDSDDTDYIMDQIRDKYLTDSTVTIVLLGKCTWARRYVDWEVYSTLRNDKKNRRSGLVAITLPSAADYPEKKLPPRVDDNVDGKQGYARWYKYPTSVGRLQHMIEEAFQARTNKADLINNTRDRKIKSSSCP